MSESEHVDILRQNDEGHNMNGDTIVAVVGTLGGAVIGIIGTYIGEERRAKRQRNWALDDEKRKTKRELMAERVEPIREAVRIMMKRISLAEAAELGVNWPSDKDAEKRDFERIQEIRRAAWTAINLIKSEELKRLWSVLAGVYSSLSQGGELDKNDPHNTHVAVIGINRILDQLIIDI